MRKNVFGRHLKRDKNERTALFKGLISSLVLHDRIRTTEDKAKAIRSNVDKIITIAKKGEMLARNLLKRQLPENVIEKLIIEIAPRFNGRHGGYTRIIRIGRRFSDNAPMVLMEWTVTKIKDQKSNIKSQKLELSEKVQEEKAPKTEKEVKARARKKVAKK